MLLGLVDVCTEKCEVVGKLVPGPYTIEQVVSGTCHALVPNIYSNSKHIVAVCCRTHFRLDR